MKKSIMYLVFGIMGVFCLAYYLLPATYYLPNAFAQTSGTCSPSASGTSIIQGGLVSAPDLANNVVNGICVIDPRAAFAPYKIPTYDDLKSLYYTQSKASKTDDTPSGSSEANQGNLRSALNSYDVILYRGGLRIGNISGTPKTAVVFVDGKLSFNQNFDLGDANSGIVFIVKGDVIIDPTVTKIDAVIIAGGTIYTAGNGCLKSNTPTTSPLTINGSLISLNTLNSSSIIFCRTLTDNSKPAEMINHQIKYLVILRNLMSDTYQKWSEIQ